MGIWRSEKPGGSNWLRQLNPDSEIIYQGLVDKYVLDSYNKEGRYQFERVGYFVVDPDSNECGYPVFNRTVTLNETAKKVNKGNNSPNKGKKKGKKGGKK